jgi:hypothetical protein
MEPLEAAGNVTLPGAPVAETKENAMKATRLLLVIVILQALTLVTLWKGEGLSTQAQAALPEPGADRKEMVNELKSANEKLAAMVKVLESGKLQVQVAPADGK